MPFKIMKSLKFIFLSVFILCAGSLTYAQGVQDLIELSQYDMTASARGMGLGNALGAIGGDFSSLSNNPGGLGVYRSSHFNLSSSFLMQQGVSEMLGETTRSRCLAPGFDGLAGVFSIGFKDKESQKGLVYLNFGVAYNKLQTFRHRFRASGLSTDENTLLDALTSLANSHSLLPGDLLPAEPDEPFYDPYENQDWYLTSAYGAYLVQDMLDSHGEFLDFKAPWEKNEYVQQQHAIDSHGSLDEMAFSVGANLSNRVYIGGTLGIQVLSRRWTKTITETSANEEKSRGLIEGTFIEKNVESGHGVNLKFGVIYRPIDQLRFGLALHSPTFFSVSNRFELSAYGDFLSPDPAQGDPDTPKTEAHSGEVKDEYTFNGPFHLQASTACFVKKYGLISFDYDMTYTPMMAFGDDVRYELENKAIQEEIVPMHEFRIGTEWYVGPVGFRMGGGYRTSPYKHKGFNLHAERFYFAGGLGFYGSWFYCDLAYRHLFQRGKGLVYAYKEEYKREFSQRKSQGLLLATIGFKF